MTSLSTKVKALIGWPRIRSHIIRANHRKCGSYCRKLIAQHNDIDYTFVKKKNISGKIVWQYWSQGYSDANMPEIIKLCLKSVESYCKKTDITLIRLSDENIDDYISLPDFVVQNKQIYSPAHFSDLLRLCLLTVYGGLWLDATILLSGPIPDEYWNLCYFVFQRDPAENNIKYWEKTYSYYFGWQNDFRVRMLNSIIFAKPGCKVLKYLRNLLLEIWKTNLKFPNYFIFQILYEELVSGPLRNDRCAVVSDCKPHLLQQYLNDPSFNLMNIDEILRTSNIHKLTYKNSMDLGRFKTLTDRLKD